MPSFSVAVLKRASEVSNRLCDFGLISDQIVSVANTSRSWANDASPLGPVNGPGMLAYVFGVTELRNQLVGAEWIIDRSGSIESVFNPEKRIRIAFQNVDKACDEMFPPMPRSSKGSTAENFSNQYVFDFYKGNLGKIDSSPFDIIRTYYVMVGEDGSVELSQPIIKNGIFADWVERIFIRDSMDNSIEANFSETESDPEDEFEIQITFKENL